MYFVIRMNFVPINNDLNKFILIYIFKTAIIVKIHPFLRLLFF